MEIALAISGILALLGGGAGALAYYRKNYAPSTATGYGPPVTVNPIQNPTVNAEGEVNLAGGGTAEVTPQGTLTDINAGIVSPIPTSIGRSTVVDASTNTPSNGPVAIGAKAGTLFGGTPVDTMHAAPAAPAYVPGSGVLH
jgi:hypothetical protein